MLPREIERQSEREREGERAVVVFVTGLLGNKAVPTDRFFLANGTRRISTYAPSENE
jgi:hypothetical protein